MKITAIKEVENARGDQMPDIDVDFPAEFRDVVKEYIKNKYGYAYTCSVGTYTRMKLKTCIKDFGKVKGVPFDLTNKLTKDIDDQIEYTWGDLFDYASRSKLLFKFIQENPELVHMCKYALLQPKAESIHPSAVIIVPKNASDGRDIDLWEWMPVKQIDGILTSEWEGKYVDKSGFLKEDILGLSQIDKFTNILQLIKRNTGKTIDVNKIEFDDDEVFRYFRRGWNEDVFQFGTTGLMNYCRQVKPTCLDDLIAMTALFRPGPMDVNAHGDFADIKAGKKKPHAAIIQNSPTIFRVTVLPPVFGPLINKKRYSSPKDRVTGTTFFGSIKGCLPCLTTIFPTAFTVGLTARSLYAYSARA